MVSTLQVNTIGPFTGTDITIETGKTLTGTASQFKITGGTAGQALITDGSGGISFGAVDSLPTQSGNADKFLKTDGTTATWETVSHDPTMGGDLSGLSSNAQIVADAVGVSQLSATGTADATTYLRGDNAWSAISAGTANEPNFFVKSTSDQVWAGSYDNFTLPTVISESDAGSWDTTNYKFTVPSGKGGVYMFVIYFLAATGNNYYVRTYINGTTEGQYRSSAGTVSGNHVIQGVFHHDLAAADEVEVQHYTGGSFTNGGATFFGFRIAT